MEMYSNVFGWVGWDLIRRKRADEEKGDRRWFYLCWANPMLTIYDLIKHAFIITLRGWVFSNGSRMLLVVRGEVKKGAYIGK